MPNNKKNPKRNPTVEETNAALAKEFAEPDSKEKNPLSESGSKAAHKRLKTHTV